LRELALLGDASSVSEARIFGKLRPFRLHGVRNSR